MGSAVLYLLINFLLLLLITHSLSSQDYNNNETHLNVYSSKATPLRELLSHDENRVKSLQASLFSSEIKTTTTNRHKASAGHVSVPLSSGLSIGSGNYFVKVGLGSPAQYYPVLVDTGSSLSWVQCQPCRIFCHAGPVFDPATSSSYAAVPCAATECKATKRATLNDPFCAADKTCVYTASYGDASFSVGYLSRDRLTLSSSQSLSGFVYGCGQDNQGLFGRSAGMLGLARDSLSLAYQAAGKFGRGFSYCLPVAAAGGKGGGGGGFLSLGGAGPPGCRYTPMITDPKNPSLYFVDLASITVGTKRIAVKAGERTIIDSGTVITRLPRGLYGAVKEAFKAAVAGKLAAAPAFSILDACFKGGMATAKRAAPVLRLSFRGGAELVVGAENAVVDTGDGVVCLAFAATDGIAIIGNRQQQRYTVTYDVDNSRIGLAPGGCM